MTLRAIATPIDSPAPAKTPPPTAADAATIVASIDASLSASTVTSPALSTTLPLIEAEVLPPMMLLARAPRAAERGARCAEADPGRSRRRRRVDRRRLAGFDADGAAARLDAETPGRLVDGDAVDGG